MKFNILENAMDSLSEAIDYYIDGKKYNDKRCYKFCILMLYHSTELILKEILVREHKVLILESIEDYNNSSEKKTIGFSTALKRVKKICGIDLGKYYNHLENMASLRNKIQHYEIDFNVPNMITIIINSFSAIEYLTYHILDSHFDDFGEVITRDQIKVLHSDEENYRNRKENILAEINQSNLVRVLFEYMTGKDIAIPCPLCSEKFLVYSDSNSIKCSYCGEKFKNMEDVYERDRSCIIANDMERELGRRAHLIDNILECLNCNYHTLIYDEAILAWKCAACGKSFDSEEVCEYNYYKGKEDWEADLADMMEDSHYSHLW